MIEGIFGVYAVIAVVFMIALCWAADDDKHGGWRR